MSTIYEIGTGVPLLRKRTEKGWTLNFVFNRENYPWVSGSTFYYWGITDEDILTNYLDNNLSFQFTDDARIKWVSYRYSGNCDSTSGYTESSYISSGVTQTLCDNGTLNDFVVTITFERNYELYNCDLENKGGLNDLILGPHAVPYVTGSVSAVTSTQIVTGYTMTADTYGWLTGDTQYSYVEELNKKWFNERDSRLGTLKIYLNGKTIYKLKNWEEIIPSQRKSTNELQQIWGGGTSGSNGLHIGESQFTLLGFTYFDTPLNFVQVKDYYVNTIKPEYNITECDDPCVNEITAFTSVGLLSEYDEYLLTEDDNIIIY